MELELIASKEFERKDIEGLNKVRATAQNSLILVAMQPCNLREDGEKKDEVGKR